MTTATSQDTIYEDVPQETKATLQRLMKLLSKQKKSMYLIFLLAFFSCLGNAFIPLVIGIALDQLIQALQNPSTLPVWEVLLQTLAIPTIILLALTLLCSLLAYWQQYVVASFGEKLTLQLRKQISEKLTKLPLRYFDSHTTGEVLSRSTNDLEKVSEVMQTGFMQFVSSVFTIVITITLMLWLDLILSVVVMISIFAAMIATSFVSRKSQIYFSKNQAVLGRLNAEIEEAYTGNIILKVFNQQEQTLDSLLALNQQQYLAMRKAQFMNYAIYPAIRILSQLGFIVTAFVGGFMSIQGQITLGSMQAFLQYVNQIGEPITQFSYVINALQAAIAGAERVFILLDEEEEIADTNDVVNFTAQAGHVTFEHVRFGYHKEHPLMKDVSLEVKPNEKVAIVGPTGGGKTTLINLLMRFYEIQGGSICIDNQDIRSISRNDLRRMIGMVLQDTWLFHGSIADNIAYGKKNATREEIIESAKAARCDHFIRTLPEGYDTMITSEQSIISQGQMQLLTIARAMLMNPTIMILDEATSSVDTRTEIEIQKAMKTIMQGKTSFVIAHRLSTILDADLIVVVKDGDIIETGNHERLLQKDGFYASLYHSQFANS